MNNFYSFRGKWFFVLVRNVLIIGRDYRGKCIGWYIMCFFVVGFNYGNYNLVVDCDDEFGYD